MLQYGNILFVSFCYLSILFAIAYYGDKRADAGRSIISNPYIYTLSIAVYCTAWTYYGSVGRAATTGVDFLPIYLGPTLMAALWWFALRKIIRISKVHHLTSIADFIASRFAKDPIIGGMVTVIAVVGIMPYISLQLKAVSTSFNVLHNYPLAPLTRHGPMPIWGDTALYVALVMAAFSILFGTRHIDVTERHEGMVAAIAFESVVKLLAFSAVGIFVSYGVFRSPTEIFEKAAALPKLSELMGLEHLPGGYASWLTLTFLSMMAIVFLPRQFQVLVVENVNEDHVKKASWLFPLYLLAINLFVLPLAHAGMLRFSGSAVDPDTFVLTLPLAEHHELLALFVFLGGLSAATGMVIVATIALSTMVCNDLLMPVLLRIKAVQRQDLSRLLLGIRRGSIVTVLLLGYLYFRLIGESYALVTIGLMSFAASAQFAPVILIGIYWKGASRRGALAGLVGGFTVWVYTLLLPSFAISGWIPTSFIEPGPFGIAWLGPYHLLGLDNFDSLTHAVFWSMLVNIGLLVAVSLFDRQGPMERIQATLFVDVFRQGGETRLWSGTARVGELRDLVARFVGHAQAHKAFEGYAAEHRLELDAGARADGKLVEFSERQLSGAIGAASARIMVSSVVEGEVLSMDGVLKILDEASQVIEYSRRLEEKSRELERATEELRNANERLTELDRMKDEFVSTVSHELRTPLTSIRALSEILHDNPDLSGEQRQEFLRTMVKETERLTRLVNQILDLAKMESERYAWTLQPVSLQGVLEDALGTTNQMFLEKSVALTKEMTREPVMVRADRDRLVQVVINLISNAVKFCEAGTGEVAVRMREDGDAVCVEVRDNGPGIDPEEQGRIFEKFHQLRSPAEEKPSGSGLGLAICRRIVEHHGGRIWVESRPGEGAAFSFSLPKLRNGVKEEEVPASGE